MKIKHTAHRSNSKIGTVEDIPDDQAFRLIQTGFAVAAEDEPVSAPASIGDTVVKATAVKPPKE